MAAWEATYGDEWVSDAVLAYDEAWAWTQAAQKAGSIDSAKVMAALEAMTNEGDIQSAYGDAMMGGVDRYGVNRELVTPIPITLIMDGTMTLEGYFLESSNK